MGKPHYPGLVAALARDNRAQMGITGLGQPLSELIQIRGGTCIEGKDRQHTYPLHFITQCWMLPIARQVLHVCGGCHRGGEQAEMLA